jgi:uncharacterized protein (DUF983 family)
VSAHLCPECGGETIYRVFSGGREFLCPHCGFDGEYEERDVPVRAALLCTEGGRDLLRSEMRVELARRKTEP